MPTVTAAFAHALTSAAGLKLTPDGDVLSGAAIVHRLTPLAGGHFDDRSFFELIDWIEGRYPDRVSLVAAYADTIDMDDLGVLGLAIKAAPTLGASIVRLERYFRLLTDTAAYRLDQSADPALLLLEARTSDHAGLTLRNECALAGFVRNARSFVRDTFDLQYVSFRHECTGNPDRYANLFGCPVIFGADQDAVAMPAGALQLPNRLGDRALSDFMTRHLDLALNPSKPSHSLRAEVSRRLSTLLSAGVPQAATLARDMGMSERTFFRRLAEEGTTFRDVLRSVQIRLARELLEQGDCTIAEIAFLTGFAEQSTFGRAFKKWVGEAPAQYRKAQSRATRMPRSAVVAGTAQRLAGQADTTAFAAL